jgi:hypothetical protein
MTPRVTEKRPIHSRPENHLLESARSRKSFARQVWRVGRLRSVRLFHVEHETALHERSRSDRRYRSGRSRPSLAQFDSGTARGMLGLFADSRPSESSSRFRQRGSCGSCPCGTVARSGSGASSGYVCDGSTVSRETRKQLGSIFHRSAGSGSSGRSRLREKVVRFGRSSQKSTRCCVSRGTLEHPFLVE